MAATKKYAVVLYDQAAEELGPLGRIILRQGSYIYAKTVEPERRYFRSVSVQGLTETMAAITSVS